MLPYSHQTLLQQPSAGFLLLWRISFMSGGDNFQNGVGNMSQLDALEGFLMSLEPTDGREFALDRVASLREEMGVLCKTVEELSAKLAEPAPQEPQEPAETPDQPTQEPQEVEAAGGEPLQSTQIVWGTYAEGGKFCTTADGEFHNSWDAADAGQVEGYQKFCFKVGLVPAPIPQS